MTTQPSPLRTIPDPDEQHLREVLRTAMADTCPPTMPTMLARNAIALGRRQRTGRRVRVASGAVAASVLAATVVPWALGGTTSGDGSTREPSDLVATQPPAPSPSPEPTPQGFWDMPSAEMVDALQGILPADVSVADPGSLVADTEAGGPAHGFINSTLARGADRGNINVMMGPLPEDAPAPGSSEPNPELGSSPPVTPTQAADGQDSLLACPVTLERPMVSCSDIISPEGTHLGRRSVTRSADLRIHEVTLIRGDGMVYAAAANTVDDKWGLGSPISAPDPLLTLGQLEEVARSDAWTSYRP